MNSLNEFFNRQKDSPYPITLEKHSIGKSLEQLKRQDLLVLQLWGEEVVLFPDGHYEINDTSGG